MSDDLQEEEQIFLKALKEHKEKKSQEPDDDEIEPFFTDT